MPSGLRLVKRQCNFCSFLALIDWEGPASLRPAVAWSGWDESDAGHQGEARRFPLPCSGAGPTTWLPSHPPFLREPARISDLDNIDPALSILPVTTRLEQHDARQRGLVR